MDEVFELISQEAKRQNQVIELIPSENYVSLSAREALGSCLVNKYAEGYPGKRYYQGNQIIDQIEELVVQRAKELFNTPHANVQPYSGSPANQAVYMATCSLGDKVLGMDLAAGGHLTHGSKVSFSGKYYQSLFYEVDPKTNLLDYAQIKTLCEQEKPQLIWAGATAYPRFFDWKKFAEIAQKTGAYLAAAISHYAGLIVGGVYPSPVDFVDIITMTTHKTLRGPRGAMIMVTAKGLKKDPELAKKIDKAVFPGLQGGPHENQIAAIGVALQEAGREDFKTYASQVIKNAQVLANELLKAGFDLITKGTDNHLILLDLRNKNINGKDAAVILEQAGIVVNANSIPFDPNPPARPSGIRLGTPAVTTKGMKEDQMVIISQLIQQAIANSQNQEVLLDIKAQAEKLSSQFLVK